MYCSKCNNPLRTRRKILDYPRGPFGPPRLSKDTEEYCGYCEWKGDAGQGKVLKDVIQQINQER